MLHGAVTADLEQSGPCRDTTRLFGAEVSVARPLSALRHASFTVALRGRRFADGPYSVRTRSTRPLTLHRPRVTRQRIPFRV